MKEGLEKYFEGGQVDVENQDLPQVETQELQEETPEVEPIELQETQEQQQEPGEIVEEQAPVEEQTLLETISEDNSTVPESRYQGALPDGVEKLVDFMNETGKGLEEYLELNKDYETLSERDILAEYYLKSKPGLDKEDIAYLISKKVYDEADYDEDELRGRKIALKEELSKAKSYLTQRKEQYYKELKANSGTVEAAQQEAALKAQENAARLFREKTKEEFKGFEGFTFDLGEKRKPVRYKADAAKVQELGVNLDNVFGKYFDSEGALNDSVGYHKAVFAAENADKIASLFLEQGYAMAVEELNKNSKNIDFDHTKQAPTSSNKLKPGQAREIESPGASKSLGVNLRYNKF